MIQIPALAPVYHNHLIWMLDLETLATRTSAVVTEVSAVAFDILTGEIRTHKTWNISVDEQLRMGRSISSGTLAFWLQQSDEAREKMLLSLDDHCFDNCLKLPVSVDFFLNDFKDFITVHTYHWELENQDRVAAREYQAERPEPILVGNSTRFDLGKIAHMYEEAGRERDMPWHFSNDLCLRALNGLQPKHKKAEVFVGIPHYGRDDCLHQIKFMVKIYRDILACSTQEADTE